MKLLTELDSLDSVKDGETRKLITKATSSGSGNVVSSVSVSGDTVTYTKGVTALTAHQNAFSNVKVGSTTVAADSAGDTLELVAGSNITLTPDATNDKVTIAATNIYNKSEVDSLISAVSTMDIQVVQTLPTQDISTTTIYLVPKTASTNDAYDEYIYVNNSWEHIGSTEVDLSNYYTKTQTDNLLDAKANASSLSTVATTGSYNDLSNKPTIPTKTSDLTNDSGFIDGLVILSYGNSTWNDFITAYQKNKVVYCRASSNSNPASGSQTRLAFMAYVNNATSPSNVEFQYYRSLSSPSVSSQPDEVYVYTLTSANKWTTTTRKASSTIAVGTGLSRSYTANTRTMTLSVDTSTMAQKSDLPTKTSDLTNDSGFITGYTETDPVFTASAASGITSSDITNWNSKQTALVSGTNIKTINNESLLGSGNINITSGGGSATDVQINGSSIVSNDVANLSVEGNYNASTNKIATMSEIPTVPTTISSFTNDSGYINEVTSSDVYNALGYYPAAEANIYTYNSIRDITSTSDQTYIDLIDDITNHRPIIIRVGMLNYANVLGTYYGGTAILWFMTSDNSYTTITLIDEGSSSVDVQVTIKDIPTKTSDLTNDSNFVDSTLTGSLSNLTTTDKSSLVNAINEVNSGVNVTTLWEGSFAGTSTTSINWTQSKYDFDTLRIAYRLDNWGASNVQFKDIPNVKNGMNSTCLDIIYGYNSSRQQIRSAVLNIYEKSASWDSARMQYRELSTSAVTGGANATSGGTITIVGIYGIGGSSAIATPINETDTGWISITPSTGTWASLRYRVIGKLVQVMGYASSLTVSNGSAGVVGAVPEEYLPSVIVYGTATGASAWIGRANVNTVNGNISIDAARTVSGAYTGSGYCGFNIMYFID